MKNIKDILVGFLTIISLVLSFVIACLTGIEVYNLFSVIGFELTHTLNIGDVSLNRILIIGIFAGVVTFVTASSLTLYTIILLNTIIENQQNSKK